MACGLIVPALTMPEFFLRFCGKVSNCPVRRGRAPGNMRTLAYISTRRRGRSSTGLLFRTVAGLFALTFSGFAADAADAPRTYSLDDAFGPLKFDQPLGIVTAPGGIDKLFVLEKTGRVQLLTRLASPVAEKKLFLDLRSRPDGKLETEGECGVLGMAWPPDHAKSGRFYVYYSIKKGGKLHQRLSRFTVKAGDPNRGDESSEQPLWTQADPASNHNGGDLQFGPDGYLYVSVGDGGAGDDHFNNARFINKGFFGAILRMDVDRKAGSLEPNAHPGIARNEKGEAYYAVPPDNPFTGAGSHHGEKLDPKTVRTEIWATGLRNPWRITFDEVTGRLFAGDIGQNLYEEVDIITKGGDYGWSHREALHPFTAGPGKRQEPPDFRPVDPIREWPRSTGVSVTGGVVYHGDRLKELKGAYVCADYGTGIVEALFEKDGKWEPQTLSLPRAAGIAGIGKDPRNGDILMANLAQGSVTRLNGK